MKAIKIIFATLAATAVLAGCAKEITPPSFENDKVNPEGTRVIAVSFAPQTKTELDGFQPKFVDNDSILISNGVAIDTCEVKVESEVATISTNLTGLLTAVYPYKAAGMSDSNPNQIDTVLVSTEQDGTFASANICMARMTDENEESLSFENKTTVFCIKPPTNSPEYVEVSAEGFDIANDYPEGSTYTTCNTIHVAHINTDSVYVSILVPDGLKVNNLKFSDGTKEKTITTGVQAGEAIAAGTLYTVTEAEWKSPEADIPGALKGKFSVSADKQVYFSKGNLRYIVGTKEWDFYEHQYDFCNTITYNAHHSDTISLFTWGYDATDSVDPDGSNYVEGHDTEGDKQLNPSEDWGYVFGGESSVWHTLSIDEWAYLFNTRAASTVSGTTNARYAKATINNKTGIILLPNIYEHPTGVTAPASINKANAAYKVNNYDVADWEAMESAGAVFLPTAGFRDGSNVYDVGFSGGYWSSSAYDEECACIVYFRNDEVFPSSFDYLYNGYSVRLVTDVPSAPTPAPTVPEGFVDLGVKDVDGNPVYWAERNLGASKPEEYGTYFSWGETGEGRSAATLEINAFTTKPFGWDQDVFGQTFNNGISQSEACPSGVLAQAYDAAYQTDSVWRMPTKEDFTDLAKQCFLEWTDNYKGTTNVKGVIVWKAKDGDDGWFKPSASGKGCKIKDDGSGYKDSETHTFSNAYAIGTDSHVFFPAAGIGHGSDLVGASDGGYYWSSSLYTDNTDNAYSLIFESGNVYPRGYFARYYGFSVRPVAD